VDRRMIAIMIDFVDAAFRHPISRLVHGNAPLLLMFRLTAKETAPTFEGKVVSPAAGPESAFGACVHP
jgi:hypothetical protein